MNDKKNASRMDPQWGNVQQSILKDPSMCPYVACKVLCSYVPMW